MSAAANILSALENRFLRVLDERDALMLLLGEARIYVDAHEDSASCVKADALAARIDAALAGAVADDRRPVEERASVPTEKIRQTLTAVLGRLDLIQTADAFRGRNASELTDVFAARQAARELLGLCEAAETAVREETRR